MERRVHGLGMWLTNLLIPTCASYVAIKNHSHPNMGYLAKFRGYNIKTVWTNVQIPKTWRSGRLVDPVKTWSPCKILSLCYSMWVL